MSEGHGMGPSRSRELVESCSGVLEQALNVRFITEVHKGEVSDETYAGYLLIEEAFVETAARLHGLAVWDAPDRDALERNSAAVHALTTEQADYFRAARAAWPVRAELGEAALARANHLSTFALETARTGGYAAVTTMLFAAETLYLTWCTRAHEEGAVRPGPIADWVALHAREPFRGGVAALAAQVDRLDRPGSELALWFTGMLKAEIVFHDALYG
ncbi:TenA family protein [Spirillospora sp. NPDC029432]|uniref:TenA family protein n=1 Tax=Spirillospora sp. NPDC029432 TaxID=3154599 RepID=UPI0034513C7F